jgi:hypothetical protein
MNLIYEGKDITNNIDINKANIIENSGTYIDNIVAHVNNSVNEWSEWKPKKNDKLELKQDGFTSGTMFIDEILQKKASVILKALPIKQQDKQTYTKTWENIRLNELLNEFASKHGLTLKIYSTENYLYSKLNQINQSDFAFLCQRCAMEGYVLKLLNNELIVYNEKYMESISSGIVIDSSEVKDGDFEYKDKSDEVYSGCNVLDGNINYTFTAPGVVGPILNVRDIMINDLAEAQRFARNYLRNKNKFERTLIFQKNLDTNITAGNTVEVMNFGLADGRYFIYQAKHMLANNITELKLRGIVEGY